MKVCVLASGSSGNCTFIELSGMKILVDAGISAKRIVHTLNEIGEDIDEIEGVFLSHEHSDHVKGVPNLLEKYQLRLFSNRETLQRLPIQVPFHQWYELTSDPFQMGDVIVQPFSVNHDAANPIAFTFQNHQESVGVVTDIGSVTNLVREQLTHVNVLVIEANYDYQMLMNGPYPWDLKQRIASRLGHLSNEDTAKLIAELVHPSLEYVFLAHRSENNNDEFLCKDTIQQILAQNNVPLPPIAMTYQRKRSILFHRS
ncbi:MAG: MBL fold metallo-hydrolase [bacterium]|nr:MBL fold metallo-hydrolase [bacterium]